MAVKSLGRSCLSCGQHVRVGELRNHGKACCYCVDLFPDIPEHPKLLETEHGMAKREDNRRWRIARDRANKKRREERYGKPDD